MICRLSLKQFFRNHFWHCSLHLGFYFVERFRTGKPNAVRFSLSGIATVDGDLLEVVDPSGLDSITASHIEVLAVLRPEKEAIHSLAKFARKENHRQFPGLQKKKNPREILRLVDGSGGLDHFVVVVQLVNDGSPRLVVLVGSGRFGAERNLALGLETESGRGI